ncbi:polysaccharide lyase [Rhizobium sp. CG5]|uniref:polysaccharide lyase n=1 Tax=Rhizobium sp. CG5 TaxID=2726076 RepID=UPI0020339812|nr:polysaccharide lyase [Rhizobium sp. CG5]
MLAGLFADPALTDDGRSQKLTDGFDGTDFASEGGLYYRENDEQAAGTYTFQSAVKRDGPGALELSVRSLCAAGDNACSERAEIWEKTELRVPYDEPVWYGFSMKLAEPVPQDDHRYLMAQWKREIGPTAEGDYSPFIALRLERGRMFFTVETNLIAGGPAAQNGHCPAGSTPVWNRPQDKQMRALVATGTDWDDKGVAEFPDCTDQIRTVTHNPLPVASSDWIDFAIYSHPDAKGKGRVEIFADGIWIATVTGHIGHDDVGLGQNQYFKFGPYRAGHPGIWTVYYDNFRRSPDCIDVLGEETCRRFN